MGVVGRLDLGVAAMAWRIPPMVIFEDMPPAPLLN